MNFKIKKIIYKHFFASGKKIHILTKLKFYFTMLELDFIKNYLKITDTQDDELILTLRDGVKIFSQQFTKIKTDEQTPKDLENAILEHIAFLYENKGKSGLDIPSRIIYIYKKYKYFRI